jgi:nitrogen fixation protein FixH
LLQALVEGSTGATQIHLTFFDADGTALDVEALSVSGVSPSGSEVPIPVELFEPGHYAATADLAPGDWEFHLQGETGDGHEIDTHFEATVP